MNLFIFTAAFYDRDYDQKLEMVRASCNKFDLELYTYGKKQTFNFYGSKIIGMGQTLNTVKDQYTHALYLDCNDAFFMTGLDEIVAKYEALGSPQLVVSGEKGLHPFPNFGEFFPETGTPWRFMNPGLYIGEIPFVLDVLSKCSSFYQLNTDDQGHWMEAYAKHKFPLVIDSQCKIFQTMSDIEESEFSLEEGRFINKITNEKPCVIHFNGGKDEIAMERIGRVFQYVIKEAV